MRTKTISKKLVAQKRIGRRCCVKKFVFEKARLEHEANGEIRSEFVFEQSLYLVIIGWKQLWLTEDDFETLGFLMDKAEWEWLEPGHSATKECVVEVRQ